MVHVKLQNKICYKDFKDCKDIRYRMAHNNHKKTNKGLSFSALVSLVKLYEEMRAKILYEKLLLQKRDPWKFQLLEKLANVP